MTPPLQIKDLLKDKLTFYEGHLKECERIFVKGAKESQLVYFCGGSDYYSFGLQDELAPTDEWIETYIGNVKREIERLKKELENMI